jgi:hypothetical protein
MINARAVVASPVLKNAFTLGVVPNWSSCAARHAGRTINVATMVDLARTVLMEKNNALRCHEKEGDTGHA